MNSRLAAVCVLLFSSLCRAETAAAILTRMDAAAPSFHAATGNVSMDQFEAILSDHTVENGTLQMQRSGTDVRAIVSFVGQNSARTIAFQGSKVILYYPKLNQYTEADLGSDSQLLNQFLLLGFGTSGKELAAGYDITEGGIATIAGAKTTKLVLIPKTATAQKRIAKVEVWIPADQAYPLQQKFYQPNGNTQTVTYSDVKINPTMNGPLTFKLPAKAKKQKS